MYFKKRLSIAFMTERCPNPMSIEPPDPSCGRSLLWDFLIIHRWTPPSMQKVDRSPEHLSISLSSARQSMTLLRNEGNLLPLPHSLRRIAVIGPNGNVARYGDYEKEGNGLYISILDGIRKLSPDASVTSASRGQYLFRPQSPSQNSADVVIMALGEREGISGEGSDRSSLDLPGEPGTAS